MYILYWQRNKNGKPFSKEYSHINSQSQTSIRPSSISVLKNTLNDQSASFIIGVLCATNVPTTRRLNTKSKINSFTHASVSFPIFTQKRKYTPHTTHTKEKAVFCCRPGQKAPQLHAKPAKPKQTKTHQRDSTNSAKQKKNFILLFCFGQ